MNTINVALPLIILAVIAVGTVLLWSAMRQRSLRLQRQFGPEYERTVSESGDRGAAESQLKEREKRHQQLELRSLPEEARTRYRDEWNSIQQRFLDAPGQSVRDAEDLVTRIMQDVGYPVEDFEQQAADISVEHPELVEKFRNAHSIANEHEKGEARTEQLRQGVASYRELVDVLLEERHGTAG